jgi:rsbT co-antagonist protein RsbR
VDNRSKLPGAPLAVIEVDANLAITSWNSRAEEFFGTASAAAIGRNLAEVLPLVGEAESWQALRAVADDVSPQVWPVQHADAVLMFEAWTQATRDSAGAATGFTLYGYDATRRVHAEARAKLETTMLQAIKDNLDIVMWAVDRPGKFLYQDGKGVRAAGLQPHQFVGMNIFDLYKNLPDMEVIRRAVAGEPSRAQGVEVHGRYWDTWYIPLADNPSTAALVGVTVDVTEAKRSELELRAKLELIERQQEVIRELATPIIEVWDGILTMPIVGLVDTNRTSEIMDSLLTAVTTTRARFAILDLTGVEVVDTGTASHLIKMIQSIRLLGAEGILTGIHPTIAQTMVALGVDLSHVAVFAKLRDALKHCLRVKR